MRQNKEVWWAAILWLILLFMIGCAHRPPAFKEKRDCVKVDVPAGFVLFCLEVDGDARTRDGKIK